MKVRSDYPHHITTIENEWIVVRDGTRLAAKIWLPEDAESRPVPAIVEFIPYRKRDGMAVRDSMMHPYFAGHGYAAVRVDLRGAGDSEGVLEDEYCPQEQQDGLDVIRWLAEQPWCSGAVGMIGISWGGFNSLQIAAHAPEELKAIITVGSTDDRYADDVHYMGGCLLSTNFTWAQTMLADLSRPPDPMIMGKRWREVWLNRLDNATFFADRWLQHQRRAPFWRHGSICENYGAIKCPVMAIGGWADSYTNAVPRLLAGLGVPRRGLIGPWGHDYPHTALPGPTIDFLAECLRWWDHWMKGRETGIMDDPMLRVWMQEAVPSDPGHSLRPGRWIGIDEWPNPGIVEQGLYFSEEGLSQTPTGIAELFHSSPQTLGAAAGEWCPYGQCSDLPADQRQDDGEALTFDTPPLSESLDVLGTPIVELSIAVDQPQALVAVRLNDVAPSGHSTRVSYGLLNLTHAKGHDAPIPVEPGKRIDVAVKLCDLGYRFLPGHRIRVSLSTAYWPTAWPPPNPVNLTLLTGNSCLKLPRLFDQAVSKIPVRFNPAEGSAPESRTLLKAGEMSRSLERDYITGRETMTVVVDDGLQRIDGHGLEIGRRSEEIYSILPGEPQSACVKARWTMSLAREDWSIRTETSAMMTASENDFIVTAQLDTYEGETRIFSRGWNSRVPRDHV